jgi:hypothetical protein
MADSRRICVVPSGLLLPDFGVTNDAFSFGDAFGVRKSYGLRVFYFNDYFAIRTVAFFH